MHMAEHPIRVEYEGTQVDIAELPDDIQKMVIEHLMQKNAGGQLGGDLGQSNKLSNTDFVQISELFSPEKAQMKDLDQYSQQPSSVLPQK